MTTPLHEKIQDTAFRRAVELLDAGYADALETHLRQFPNLVRATVAFEGRNYFNNPTLLEFVAENPIRNGALPGAIVDVAQVIIRAGAARESVSAALVLVASGRIARECGAQVPLIDMLCDHGGAADAAMYPALSHGEFEAVDALIRRGGVVDLVVAAGINRIAEVSQILPAANGEMKQRALAIAAIHGHAEVVERLLSTGADPNRFNPAGFHTHSTPLHQAALAGHFGVVQTLVAAGASLDVKDALYGATPRGWAMHAGKRDMADYLGVASE
ncbi:MAG: ankyrin repeat domain-containing protein [Rhodobacteraceae bacterium]|nr:ankyrin repeat domain-containing protein [Paracoccaceae bacterium]